MTKIIEIDSCKKCLHRVDNMMSEALCFAKSKRGRLIQFVAEDGFPPWCPLPDAKEDR